MDLTGSCPKQRTSPESRWRPQCLAVTSCVRSPSRQTVSSWPHPWPNIVHFSLQMKSQEGNRAMGSRLCSERFSWKCQRWQLRCQWYRTSTSECKPGWGKTARGSALVDEMTSFVATICGVYQSHVSIQMSSFVPKLHKSFRHIPVLCPNSNVWSAFVLARENINNVDAWLSVSSIIGTLKSEHERFPVWQMLCICSKKCGNEKLQKISREPKELDGLTLAAWPAVNTLCYC